MKRAALALLLFCAVSLSAQIHIKFNASGATAAVNGTDGSGGGFSLSVARGTNNGTTTTNFSYFAATLSPDFSTETATTMFGQIPNSAFTGRNTQHLTLNFDAAKADPTVFFSQTCVIDLNSFTVTCTPGPTGVFKADFSENGIQRTRLLTVEQVQTFSNTIVRSHLSGDQSTANAKGTILGQPVATAEATVGINKNSTIEIIRP